MSLPKIHCRAVRVPTTTESRLGVFSNPEDLVPGADPYIAALLRRLEADIDALDRQSQLPLASGRMSALRAEVPPPLTGDSVEFQSPGDGQWFWWEGR